MDETAVRALIRKRLFRVEQRCLDFLKGAVKSQLKKVDPSEIQ